MKTQILVVLFLSGVALVASPEIARGVFVSLVLTVLIACPLDTPATGNKTGGLFRR